MVEYSYRERGWSSPTVNFVDLMESTNNVNRGKYGLYTGNSDIDKIDGFWIGPFCPDILGLIVFKYMTNKIVGKAA